MKISIPEPCHEDWNLMAPVEFNRRHCTSCDRTLTDFSGMTDAEVGTYLRRNPGKLCGRFAATQLDRKLALGGPQRFAWLRAAAAASGLLLAVPAVGQSVDKPGMTIVAKSGQDKPEVKTDSVDNRGQNGVEKMISINGQVTDGYGEVLIGASILVSGSCTGTVTDIDGRFSIVVGAGKEVLLVISYTGFATQEYYIDAERTLLALTEDHLSLELDNVIIAIETAAGYVVTQRSLAHRIFVAPVRRYVIWPVRKAVRGIGDWRAGRFERRAARQLLREERRASRLAEQPIDKRADMAPGQVFLSEQPELVAPEQLGFKASPNPFNDFVRVEFVLPERQAYRLQLISATGQTIGEWKQTGEKGRQEIILDQQLAGLPAGTYLLELTTRTTSVVLLLVR